MKKINSNSGVTLAMLIVLIIVMLILLGLVLNFTTKPIQNSIDTQYKSELLIIQHTLYEKYKEAEAKGNSNIIIGQKIVKENFPGEDYLLFSEFPEFLEAYKKVHGEEKEPQGNYYLIMNNRKNPAGETVYYEYLDELGLTGERIEESEFIVNYETGEVYNNTKKFYNNGSPLYLPGYGINENDGTSMSNMIDY